MFETTKCPNCGNQLFLPKNIRNEKFIKCAGCKKNFENPTIKTKMYWGIAIVAFILFAIYSNMTSKNEKQNSQEYNTTNYSNSNSSSGYYINTTTYGATSKKALDDMYVYLSNNDNNALSQAISNGQIIEIPVGTNVNVVKNHFSYTIVKIDGSTEDIYVVTDHLSQD